MTREEILQIEMLTDDDLAKIDEEARKIGWDLRLCFIGLCDAYDNAPPDINPFSDRKFKETCQVILDFIGIIPLGNESALSSIFAKKWEILNPMLSNKDLELSPSEDVLNSWAKGVAYTLDGEPIYKKLATTFARLNSYNPSYQVTELVTTTRKLSSKLKESRKQVYEIAQKLGNHDEAKGKEILTKLEELAEIQRQILVKRKMVD